MGELAGTSGAASVLDASGNGRTGTPSGITFGVAGSLAGDTDTAATFTDNNGILLTGVPDLTTALSFECAFKLPSIPPTGGNYRTLMAKGASGDTTSRNFGFDLRIGGSGSPRVEMYWTASPGSYIERYTDMTLAAGSWHHLIWSVDWSTNPDTVALYVNGVSQTVTTLGSTNSSPGITGVQVSRLGAGHTATDGLNGSMDEGILYSAALSPVQAAARYAAWLSNALLLMRRRRSA